MAITVDNLELEITTNGGRAIQAIDNLTASLRRLKESCKDGAGLNAVANAIRKVNKELNNDYTGSAFNRVRKEASKVKDAVNDATSSILKYSLAIREVGEVGFPTRRPLGIEDKHTEVGFFDQRAYDRAHYDDYIDAEWREIPSQIGETSLAIEDLNSELKDTENVAKSVAKEAKKTSEKVKKVGESAKHASGKLTELFRSFKRIAVYRALRTVLKSITQGFSEGVSNIKEYSKALNGLDSSNVSGNLAEMSNQFLYMKNAVASAAAPLIKALVPVVQKVAEWFVNASNAVAQFIATLQGKNTFTKAKFYIQDTSDSLKDATDNAKSLKAQLQGFDELNNLTTNSTKGAAANSPDYSEMFEEAFVDSDILKAKESIEGILDVVKDVGIALLAWTIGDEFVAGLTNLNQTIGQIVKGALELSVGVFFSFKGGEKLAKDDILSQIAGVFESTTGLVLSAIGGKTITTALGLGGPLGAIIGIGISLGATIAGFVKGTEEECKRKALELFYGTEEGSLLKQLQSEIDSTHQKAVDFKVRVGQITGEIDEDTQIKFVQAEKLIDELFNLDEKENKTSEEIKKIKELLEQINGLGLNGLKLEFDDTKKHVTQTRNEVKNLIEDIKKQYQIEALKNDIKELYHQEALAVVELKNAEREYNEALTLQDRIQTKVTSATKEYDEALKEFTKFCEDHAIDAAADLSNGTDELSKTFTRLKTRTQKAEEALIPLETGLNVAKEETAKAKESMDFFNDGLKEAKKKTIQFQSALDTLNGKIVISTSNVKDLITEWQKYNNMNIAPKTASIEIQTAINGMQASGLIRTEIAKGEDLNGNGIIGFANGGVVPRSHLFYANEDGNPEYIGNMGGHTAVANSDQMSQAIESASYRGMARALAENGGSITLQVEGDPQGMFRVIQKQANNYTRRTGNQAFA